MSTNILHVAVLGLMLLKSFSPDAVIVSMDTMALSTIIVTAINLYRIDTKEKS